MISIHLGIGIYNLYLNLHSNALFLENVGTFYSLSKNEDRDKIERAVKTINAFTWITVIIEFPFFLGIA